MAQREIKEMAGNYTEQQLELIAKLESVCKKAEELWHTAKGYVVDGFAGDIHYCYCGEGNGYQGAPLRPASIWAVVFETEQEAKQHVLTGYKNGAGDDILLKPCVAWYYFWRVYDEMRISIETTKLMMQEINNNK